MNEFRSNIFYSQIQRLPLQRTQELLENYENDLRKLSFVDINQIFNFLDTKAEIVSAWHQSTGMIDLLTFKMLAKRIPIISKSTFEELDNLNNLHPTIQVEIAFHFDENERMNLLNNFGDKLSPILIQEIILALTPENQSKMLSKYKSTILSSEQSLFLSFIGTLDSSNQKEFLALIKPDIVKMDIQNIIPIVLEIYNENIAYFFHMYQDTIDSLDDKAILDFLSMLQGPALISFSDRFKNRIQTIPASSLMYKLGTSIDDAKQIYTIWSNNQSKLSELSDNYFNLVISRLDDESRLHSLTDFKERYSQMSTQQLLDLFEFDKDEYKVKLFLEYPDKINALDNCTFITYINENISDVEQRNQLFLAYKAKIYSMPDDDFIYFITDFSEVNLKYVFSIDDLNEKKLNLVEYIFNNFGERLKSISLENISKLFNNSNPCLQHKYIEFLSDNIKKIILDKTYLEELLKSAWGDSRRKILETFSKELETLKAQDWYNLHSVIDEEEFKIIEKYLLTCQIDNFDFIDAQDLLDSGKLRRIFYYFEQNLQTKLLDEYTALAENQEKEKLLAMYEATMTQVMDEDAEYVLCSYSSIKLLVLLRVLLKYHIINDKDDYYQMFKELYISKLVGKLDKEKEENVNLIKDSLFYRLIKGSINSTSLLSIKTLKGLIFFSKNVVNIQNRKDINVYAPAEIEKFVVNLTEEQVVTLNNKLFKQICSQLLHNYEEDNPSRTQVRNLAIRLYMSVGYNNAKRLIDLHVPFTRYEFIFNGIDIKKIKMNENGEPIINKKLQDFMFGSNMNDENTNINRLLQEKIPNFERRFSEIYNGWETIYQNLNGNVTVARILKWFEDNKILLNPDEYRLSAVIGEIGNNEKNLTKARELYADMKRRKFSTIPKVMGSCKEEYTYEMLDLDDPLGLVVGYITRCCFLIDGASRTALFHSAQSKDGRIFIVRKNGELIAQSWVWRNGNLVCFDNVESRGSYDYSVLLETYKKAAEDILAISTKTENTKEKIKLVTFGGGYSKIAKPQEKVPYNKIHTPRVEQKVYTDAAYEQFILASNGESELYYGDVNAEYIDLRSKVERYSRLSLLEREDKSKIIKKKREIDYLNNGTISEMNFDSYKYIALAEDWYLLLSNTGEVECVLLPTDQRAKEEIYEEIDNLPKTFKELGIGEETKTIGEKVLSLVKGSDMQCPK